MSNWRNSYKGRVRLQNGCIFGVADDASPQPARTVLTFLISLWEFKRSCKPGPYKATKWVFADTAKNVISQMVDSGLQLLCVITDNNRVNNNVLLSSHTIATDINSTVL